MSPQDLGKQVAANLKAFGAIDHDIDREDAWGALQEQLAKQTIGVIRGLYLSGNTEAAMRILNNIKVEHLK